MFSSALQVRLSPYGTGSVLSGWVVLKYSWESFLFGCKEHSRIYMGIVVRRWMLSYELDGGDHRRRCWVFV